MLRSMLDRFFVQATLFGVYHCHRKGFQLEFIDESEFKPFPLNWLTGQLQLIVQHIFSQNLIHIFQLSALKSFSVDSMKSFIVRFVMFFSTSQNAYVCIFYCVFSRRFCNKKTKPRRMRDYSGLIQTVSKLVLKPVVFIVEQKLS